MSIETAVLIGKGGVPLYWRLEEDRSAGFIPDSRSLWDVIWEHRAVITGLAHSHPGGGLPRPSHTDLTTFMAIENGLGRALHWWIISEDGACLVIRAPYTDRFVTVPYRREEVEKLPWYEELWKHSYKNEQPA